MKGTADHSLYYSGYDLFKRGYMDVDWASDLCDR